MRYQIIARPADAFQQPIDSAAIERLCRRAFGDRTAVTSVIELPWGSYNSSFRVDFADRESVVLRAAPEPERQFAADAGMLRNEYAAAPYFAVLGTLAPRTLFADFTRQLIGRDYLVQMILPGVPAPEAMAQYDRPLWSALFRQIGAFTRKIHSVPGPAFGPINGPVFDTWSAYLIWYFRVVADDIAAAGHDGSDVRRLAAAAERHADLLDQVREPRLLHGDGWTANFLVDPATADLTVTGICDWDRAVWGDPLADWGIQRALLRPGSERDTFWEGYGSDPPVIDSCQSIYQARQVVDLRLDHIRAGDLDKVERTRADLAELLSRLTA